MGVNDNTLDVTVVLTAYKRIDSLKLQLDAISAQTQKPKEIWLFQDKVAKDYFITIQDQLLEAFDNVYIANENIGVWGRFEFARKAKTKYVCIFDDDTIPGERWFENCFNNITIQSGIYGAIGIVLFENTEYPSTGFCRVGWARPNKKVREVDFVGHSWFLETRWLDFMMDEAIDMKKYKYAAEDMSLSYAASLHGIKTYVPEQPFGKYELWGSQPDLGTILGEGSVALSSNGNWSRMNKAVLELLDNDWNCLYKRKQKYVSQVEAESNSAHRKLVLQKIYRLFSRKQKTY